MALFFTPYKGIVIAMQHQTACFMHTVLTMHYEMPMYVIMASHRVSLSFTDMKTIPPENG